jgi:hypothetical protein
MSFYQVLKKTEVLLTFLEIGRLQEFFKCTVFIGVERTKEGVQFHAHIFLQTTTKKGIFHQRIFTKIIDTKNCLSIFYAYKPGKPNIKCVEVLKNQGEIHISYRFTIAVYLFNC